MVGVGISVAEPLIFGINLWLARLFDNESFLHLGRISPFYNIENINSWVRNDQAVTWLAALFEEEGPVDSMDFSVLMLAIWLAVGIGLVLYWFQRQDITT